MERFWAHIGAAVGLLLVGIIVAALIVQRSMFPLLSSLIVNDMIIAAVLAIPTCLVIAVLLLFRGRDIEAGPSGNYIQSIKGFKALPPLALATPKLTSGNQVTEVTPKVPRLGELIKQGLLTEQDTDGVKALMGVRPDETLRYEPLPGVTAILGMQNVGKSVTMVLLIIIALFQGAKVVICDTHYNKGRSLWKKTESLTGLVTFALTEKEVLQETRNFSAELRNRKNGSAQYPYIVFYDEFRSLMRSDKIPELKDELTTVMDEGSQEGQGFHMHLVCAIHDLSGLATFRAFFNWIYCHKMEPGQSKFIEAFNTRKTRTLISGLPQGHVVVKEGSEIEYLIIPEGGPKDVLVAREMLQGAIPERSGGIHATRNLRLIKSPEHEDPEDPNRPLEPSEQGSGFILVEEESEASGGLHMKLQMSIEDSIKMATAYSTLATKGQPFTRKMLMEQCGWTRYKWNVIKAWCDERHLLLEEVKA